MASPVKAVLAFVENGDEVAIKKILATDPNIKVYDFDPRGICWEFYANVPIDDVVELINGRCWSGLLVVFATPQSATMFAVALDTIPVGNVSMLFPTNNDNVLLEYLSELDPTMSVGDDVVSSVFEQDFPEDNPTPDPEEISLPYTAAVVAYFDAADYSAIKEVILKENSGLIIHDFDPSAHHITDPIVPIADETEMLGVNLGIAKYTGALILATDFTQMTAVMIGLSHLTNRSYCMLFPTTTVDRIWEALGAIVPDQLDTTYTQTEKGIRRVSSTSDSPAQ